MKCTSMFAIGMLALIGALSLSIAADPLSLDASDVTVTRGDSASLSCTASGGCPPYTYKWTSWTAGNSSAEKSGASISAKILATCSVTATVTDANNATASKTVAITVTKRDWNVIHHTNADAWSNWGSFPFGTRGENINADNSSPTPIIGEIDGDWSAKVTTAKITDSNGPFSDYWYNSTHALRVNRETRINQYLKGAVAGSSVNWVSLQNSLAASPGSYSPVLNASAIHSGVAAHENQGNVAADFTSSPKKGGHSALFKAKQDSSDSYNAAKEIEPNYNPFSKADLEKTNNNDIDFVNNALAGAGTDPLVGNYDTYMIIDHNTSTGTSTIVRQTR